MSVSTYVPSVIDESLYERTKKDTPIAFASTGKVYAMGALAGVLAPWLPAAIIFPLVFFYKWRFSGRVYMTPEEKLAQASDWLSGSFGAYAKVAIWLCLILGAYGVLMAILRRKSILSNKYIYLNMAKRNIYMGLDQQLTIVLIPVASIVGLFLAKMTDVLIIGFVLIILAGAVYYQYWMKLHNLLMVIVWRKKWEERTALALRLMIPRTVGWKNARVDEIEVDTVNKSARVKGEFVNKDMEQDARNITGHYLRGYHPIYLVNTKETQ
ncbi:MAG TPA: hypothetical protein GXX29_13385 [Firmicutes bacterium]|nr:hypothetical protein [Bacillota bacterium]